MERPTHPESERDSLNVAIATLTEILDSLTDGRMAFDREWRFTHVDDRAARHLGRPRDELVGRVVWDLFPEMRGSIFDEEYGRAVRERTPRRFEAPLWRANVWVEAFCHPLPDGLAVSFRDVSNRRRDQDALDAANRDLRQCVSESKTLLDVLPVATAVSLDRASSAVRTNRAWARMLRLDPSADESLTTSAGARPRHYKVICDGRELTDAELPLQVAAREGREVRELDVEIVFADGTSLRAIEYATPLFDDDGQPRGSVGVLLDVTDRKRAEDERERVLDAERRAHAEADRANRLKDEFLASLSHELRTPLNAILGWAQLLRTRPPSPEFLEQGLETLERNARLQAQLIDDLLDMSRILSGHLRLDVQQVNLPQAVEASVEAMRPAAEAKGIHLQMRLDPRSGSVIGDPSRLQQVFWNLLANAVKFTPRGGRVQIALERSGSHFEVSVSDTGIGIAPAFLPYVFERFRQADSSMARTYGGLGLGLSIAKELVELHGGSIRAESQGASSGATFIIDLPAVADAEAGEDDRATPRSGRDAAAAANITLAGVSVLVVDDDHDARQLASLILEARGASVQTAASASDALQALLRRRPDVIVSDLGLPGRDGFAFIQAVRALADEYRHIPALALTAFARSEDRRQALAAGFQLHLAKPVEAAELCTAVASLAEGLGT